MKSFIEQAQYYPFEQNTVTFYIHLIAIPLLLFSLMILLSFFHLVVPGVFEITLAMIITFILIIYYLLLNWRLALLSTPFFSLLLWIASLVAWAGPTKNAFWIFLFTFLGGALCQLIGHFLEEKHPLFSRSFFCYMFIAPLCLTAEILFKFGHMQKLKNQIIEQNRLASSNSAPL